MAEVEVREVLHTAQAALEGGRHQEAITACLHVRQHYPESITALRLLGEAFLEVGRADDARRAFEKVLALDPYNVLARIGLAVIAEDRGEEDRAIGQFRLAWEADPTLPQLRGELARLYRKRFGAGGRLRLTRIALANLHARNEELLRAMREYRALLAEHPQRVDLPLGLAEALWRHDDFPEAADRCARILGDRPQTARAHFILADIAGRDGKADEAAQHLGVVRRLDPDAELARGLAAGRPDSATLHAYIDETIQIPAYDPAAPPADLDLRPAAESAPAPAAAPAAAEPLSWEAITQSWGQEAHAAAMPTADEATLFAELEQERTGELATAPAVPDDVAPFDWDAIAAGARAGEPAGAATQGDTVWDAPADDDPLRPAPDEPTAVERLTANWDNIDSELDAARPSAEAEAGQTGLLRAVGDLDVAPFDLDALAHAGADEPAAFDAANFSLPPLDEDDQALEDLGVDTSDIDADVAPFSLEGQQARGDRRSFADLLDAGTPPEATWPPAPQTAALGDDEARSPYESIFLTRELHEPEGAPPEAPAAVPEAAATPQAPAPGAVDLDDLQTRQLAWPGLTEQAGAPGATPEATPAAGDQPPAEDVAAGAVGATAAGVAWAAYHAAEAEPAAESHAAPAESAAADDDEPATDRLVWQGVAGTTPPRPEAAGAPTMLPAEAEPDIIAPAAAPAPVADFTAAWLERHEPRVATATAAPVADFRAAWLERREPATAAPAVADFAAPWLERAPATLTLSAPPATAEAPAPEPPSPPTPTAPPATAALAAPADTATLADAAPVDTAEWRDAGTPAETAALAEEPAPAAAEPAPPVAAAPPSETPPDSWAVIPDWIEPEPAQRPEPAPQPTASAAWDAWDTTGAAPADAAPAEPPAPAQSTAPAAAWALPEQPAPTPPAAQAAPPAEPVPGPSPDERLTEYRRLVKESPTVAPEVVAGLQEMVAAGTGGTRAHRVLGDAYMKLGQFDLATAEYQRALATRVRK
ncbi:MAG TPA: tetratricopeptide repeat protein [Thermomicrobiales bacterium]|nr:tetratricopeptide repeat protein [Thermomicrobiales bacterium]